MKETEFCTLSSDNKIYFPEAEMILEIQVNKEQISNYRFIFCITLSNMHCAACVCKGQD